MHDRVLIAPATRREAATAAAWLRAQGDMRGFIVHEPAGEYLIVFDSYGATHETLARALFTRRDDTTALIFRLNGEVYIEARIPYDGIPAFAVLPENIATFLYWIYGKGAVLTRD